MASRNRAHALVNIVHCNSIGIQNHSSAPSTSAPPRSQSPLQVNLTGPHSARRLEPQPASENNSAEIGRIQLEDLISTNPPRSTSVTSVIRLESQPVIENDAAELDFIQIEDILGPLIPSRPTSAASVTQGSSDTFCDYSPDDDSDYELPNNNNSSSSSETIDIQLTEKAQDVVHFGDMAEGRQRKKKAEPENWKKNKSKRLRMEGKEYVGYERPKGETVKSKIRNRRVLGPRCNSIFCKNSKIRCCDEIKDEDRENIFSKFWNDMDWHQRKVYVANNVTYQGKGRQTTPESSRRAGTFVYFLPVSNPVDETTVKKRVCRDMFLQTLCLGSFSVQNWAKKGQFGIHLSEENMNLNRLRPRALSQRRIAVLDDFLDGLPKMPSHYNRMNTSKIYLEPIYRNAAHLYRIYKQFCADKGEEPYARNKFRETITSKNIAIHTIKKDMCDVCVGHETGNVSDNDFQEHLRRKDRAREEKTRDKNEAINGNSIVLSMDLQAVKVCPFITASAVYYKTKLCVHNFTIYDLASHDCTCYWFSETEGDLTASTYASFITDYLARHCLPKRLPIIIYSDGCTSQNRNNILSNALLNFSMIHEVSITQKYLEVGHTQMEGDCVHSAIERKLKNRLIHLPSDFISVTREARKNPREYEALMVDHTFFRNFAAPETWRYTSVRPGRKAGDPKVTDIKAILYDVEGIIKFKLKFDADWETLPQRVNKIAPVREYSPLHRTRLPITYQKYKHLQELKSVIPLDCHLFYDSLPYHDH